MKAQKLVKFCFLFSIICLLFISKIYAWSYRGHVLIAEMAYMNLTPKVRMKVDILSEHMFNQLPMNEQDKLSATYPNVSTFAKLAYLPDVWRNKSFQTLAYKFHSDVPFSIQPFSNTPIAPWHYVNLTYPASYHCHVEAPANVAKILPNLITSFKTTNKNTQALLMVFIEHLVADIHQPLHAVSLVDKTCHQDRGGTDTCLKTNKHGICTKNLHDLWDNAIGTFNRKVNIERMSYSLLSRYRYLPLRQVDNLNIDTWLKEDYSYVPFIYEITNPSCFKPHYYKEAHAIADERMVLASLRLAGLLNILLSG